MILQYCNDHEIIFNHYKNCWIFNNPAHVFEYICIYICYGQDVSDYFQRVWNALIGNDGGRIIAAVTCEHKRKNLWGLAANTVFYRRP